MQAITVKRSGYITLPKFAEFPNGDLSVLEGGRHVPFQIKRVYFVNNLSACRVRRGNHAHRRLDQVIFCVNGSFLLGLDDGEQQCRIRMDRDNVGVRLGPGLWHTMEDFSPDCVIMVVASDVYEESDYLRNYDDFLEFLRAGGPA